ncbi:type I restriction endonuclease [Hyphomicrobium sp. DMF-1]|jgi:hypothetical protein|uniref:type I restriction endonuclease n=1 Tax=Hyphomicrobium sp. DMF-1 TaxID=3019544 RepID=UPI0022EC0635|nr:type I restriction enzyme HsdR N-terminal domain-containing protein [Hyphomicrobium sp. DMF-1]WBT39459.1 type I restriction enzyme HsdR N-terminal domain-containing protein [Hyphomicrobium sp. DMF-1]
METLSGFQENLTAIAQRSAAIKSACSNEESTKLYLVLPVIGALGYDYTDPFVVQPEYAADFRNEMPERVDYVVMADGNPVIAIECKKVGTDLSANRGQLRTYFSALQTVHLGIMTDGIRFEFFVDCENPNVMDQEPFLTLDMEAATRSPIPADVIEALSLISRSNFHPDVIAEAAEERLVAKRLRAVLMQEVREPSDELCRLVLQRVGMRNVRRTSIQTRYSSLIRSAFEDALVLPVLDKLRSLQARKTPEIAQEVETAQRIVTTDRELAVYRYVCRRLAYLAADEYQFAAVERVQHKDYVGKFVVYYERERKGRLFDFIEGSNGYDKFIFPEPFGEIITNSMSDIDQALKTTFTQRIRELASAKASEAKQLQTA